MVKLPRFFILSFLLLDVLEILETIIVLSEVVKKILGVKYLKLKTCTYCRKIHGKEINCTAKRGYYRDKNTRYKKDKDYIKFIKSKQWNNKSQEIKLLDSHCCLVCKSLGLVRPVYLEVHHINKVRNDYEKRLENDNLITLCVFHHKQADNNKISTNELYRLINKYRDTTVSNDIVLL